MGLTNIQYDAIMRGYHMRQLQNQQELQDRKAEAARVLPQLDEIDHLIITKSTGCARALLNGQNASVEALRQEINELSAAKKKLLTDAGFPEDHLEMHYHCNDCQDTGYIGSEKCHCLRQASIDLLYMQSNLRDVLQKENFSSFSLSWYSDSTVDPITGLTSRQTAQKALTECQRFTETFDSSFDNLFIFGDTGLGKTFLSHCIADALLKTTHSVIYFSAYQLFETCADLAFRQNDTNEKEQFDQQIFSCDLLIIDDLGTEMTNSFVSTQLFHILNERLLQKKSTIISTNLSLSVFADTYSERVFSRISSNYTMLKMFGRDIRIQKKIGNKP